MGGGYPITAGSGWAQLATLTVDTGYVVGAWWSSTDRSYQASAGINGGTVVIHAYSGAYGTYYANWSVIVRAVYPKSRWWTATTLMLELELWAEVDGDGTFQIDFPNPTWSLFKVT
jgi:hypothetical protein